MVTINDIAKEAGVAKSTVSRYLNGGSVSPKTAKKIAQIIAANGYVPNTFAQSLKAKNSKMVGAVIPRLDSHATNTIIAGVEETLKKSGYRLTIMNTNLDPEMELEALQQFQVTKMDGIIFLMTHFSKKLEQAIKGIKVPVVAVGQKSKMGDAIYFNEVGAAEQMADYLYDAGHRSIHFLKVTESDPAVGVIRRIALQDRFLSYPNTVWYDWETGFNMEDAYKITKQHIVSKEPQLIVGSTDMLAIGAMKACLEAGIKVPEQVSIAGFGNHTIGQAIYPGLTSVEYPYRSAGQMAAQHLLNRIQERHLEASIQLSTHLIKRESVAHLEGKIEATERNGSK